MKESPTTVLVVEDNPDHARVIKDFLEKQDKFQVDITETGEDCLQKIAQVDYHLILLDYRLPDEDGLTILKTIKDRGCQTPVVIVTGQGDERIAVDAMKAGAYDYVVKSEEYLVTLPLVIARVMEKHRFTLERQRMSQQILQRNRELAALNSVASIVSSTVYLEEMLRETLNKVIEVLGAKGGGIYIIDEQAQEVILKVHKGLPAGFITRVQRMSLTDPVVIAVMTAAKAVVLPELLGTRHPLVKIIKDYGIENPIGLALSAKKKIVGLINVAGRAFEPEELTLLEAIAHQIGIGIENARLFAEAKRLKEFNENIVQSMGEGIFIEDSDGIITFVNPKMETTLEYAAGQLLGKHWWQILAPAHLPRIKVESQRWLTAEMSRLETVLLSQKGKEIPVILSVRPLFEDCQFKGMLAVCTDITEIKKLEQQLIQSEKIIAIGQLVSGVAHELNNPLTGVIGFSELLLAEELSEKTKKELKIIHHEALRCQKILSKLLMFGRKCKPEKSYVSINEIIDSSLELTAHQFRANNVEIVKQYARHLPRIMADYYQLQQVFHNLITNALQAMVLTNGESRLVIKTEADENLIRIKFIDNGPGIPSENLNKVFDPFFTTKEVGEGMGLGLSVCYGIINEHQGRIYVESSAEGAIFIVELPIQGEPTEKT